MEIFTLEDFEKNFDQMIKRVENGEQIGIIGEDGRVAIMVPADDDFLRIHTEHNDAP